MPCCPVAKFRFRPAQIDVAQSLPEIQSVFVRKFHDLGRPLMREHRLASQLVKLRRKVSGEDPTCRMGKFSGECQGSLHSFQCAIWIAQRPHGPRGKAFTHHFAIMSNGEV